MSDSFTMTKIVQNPCIVYDLDPILLVGGAEVSVTSMKFLTSYTGKVVGADGGITHILHAGRDPEAVIGDFDSLPEMLRSSLPVDCLHHISEQNSTDFEKCLTRIDAPLVLALGFTGGRLDHELAALHVLLAFPERRCILIGEEDVLFLAPPQFNIDLPAGCRFSVMPLAPVRAKSDGLRWPLGGLEYAPGLRIGTSNEVIAGPGDIPVSLSVDRPSMLVILPREHLDLAVKSLLAAPESGAHWPARAK